MNREGDFSYLRIGNGEMSGHTVMKSLAGVPLSKNKESSGRGGDLLKGSMMAVWKSVGAFVKFSAVILGINLAFTASFLQGEDLRLKRLNPGTVLVSGGPQNVNITAFLTEAGIVLVDTGESEAEGKRARKLIEEVFPGAEFAYLINTHSHWDHISGNSAFPGVQIVAHQKCRDSIEKGDGDRGNPAIDRDVPRAETDSLTGEVAGDIPPPPPPAGTIWFEGERYDLTVPDITFTDSMSIHCGNTTFNLHYFGETHTVSDILIVVPEAGILLAGDLFFHNWLPVFSPWIHPDPGRWQAVRDILLAEETRFEAVIPGHGPLMDREELEKQFNYRLAMWDSVERSYQAGNSLETTLKELDIREVFPDMVEANIRDSRGRTVHEENIRAIYGLLEKRGRQ